jgi:hypothetical protein
MTDIGFYLSKARTNSTGRFVFLQLKAADTGFREPGHGYTGLKTRKPFQLIEKAFFT